jgi:hypothetical protein
LFLFFSGAAANAPLLDQQDPALQFVTQREDLNPIALFRISPEEFVLCFEGVLFIILLF